MSSGSNVCLALVVMTLGCGVAGEVEPKAMPLEKAPVSAETPAADVSPSAAADLALTETLPASPPADSGPVTCSSTGSHTYDAASLAGTVRGLFFDMKDWTCGKAIDSAMDQLNSCKASTACPNGGEPTWGAISSTPCALEGEYDSASIVSAGRGGIDAQEIHAATYGLSMTIKGSCDGSTLIKRVDHIQTEMIHVE